MVFILFLVHPIVNEIGDSAFDNCYIASITLGSGLTSIGQDAFAVFDRYELVLTDVAIPASVGYIGQDAFSGYKEITFTVTPGSYAETWATENNVSFKPLNQ